jgi:hypothetical protein
MTAPTTIAMSASGTPAAINPSTSGPTASRSSAPGVASGSGARRSPKSSWLAISWISAVSAGALDFP